jgi:hypothetical protein
MELLMQVSGYLVAVLAAGAIVAGIETLNGRCPYAPFRGNERLAANPVRRPVVLRRPGR